MLRKLLACQLSLQYCATPKHKDQFKPIKHVGQTFSNIVGCNMLEHHNQTYWIVLDGVGWSLTLFKLFIKHCPTFSFTWTKICHHFMPSTETQHCWMVLDSFEHSSIHLHNPTLIKHRPTSPNNVGMDNVWTNMFDPFERALIATFVNILVIHKSDNNIIKEWWHF